MPIIVDHDRFYNHDAYEVNLHGTKIEVTVTAAASVVRRWINSTLSLHHRDLERNRLVVGLGVQWTPCGCGRDSPADTLQLCIRRRCLIFQLFHANRIPTTLRNFLRNPDLTFVGFWNHSDRRKLESSEHRFEMYRDPLDLRYYAVAEDDDEDLSRAPIHEIVENFLGYDVELEHSREIRRSDWDDEYLSHEQVVYASIDAYCAFRIGKNIKAWRYT